MMARLFSTLSTLARRSSRSGRSNGQGDNQNVEPVPEDVAGPVLGERHPRAMNSAPIKAQMTPDREPAGLCQTGRHIRVHDRDCVSGQERYTG